MQQQAQSILALPPAAVAEQLNTIQGWILDLGGNEGQQNLYTHASFSELRASCCSLCHCLMRVRVCCLAEETQLGWQLGVLSVLPAKVTEAMAHMHSARNMRPEETTEQSPDENDNTLHRK
jgi:hypothetical protein